MNVHVHIERLVLDGLPLQPAQAPAVQSAVEAELARLLTADGLPPDLQRGGGRSGTRAADVALPPTTAPDHLGTRLGKAIHEGMNR